MKNDAQIQQDVIDQLRYEPILNYTEIGVAVKDGVVTLSGIVDTYYKKSAAERAAKKVAGVRAIAEDIQVHVNPLSNKEDSEIAATVLSALRGNAAVPNHKLKVKVEKGDVTLEGELHWEFQRSAAIEAIRHLEGVHMVYNQITLNPALKAKNVEQKIAAAFHRSATIDASRVTAEVQGSEVTLKGVVRSFAELEDAEAAAWSAPGVTSVHNHLQLDVLEIAH